MPRAILGAAIGLALAAGPAAAQLTLDSVATQGNPVTVRVAVDGAPASGVPVTATYRPGSQVPRTVEVGRTGADGNLSWVPDDAGIVTLSAAPPGGAALSRNVSVRFRGVPGLGVVIMVVAGFILYGSILRGFRSMGIPPPSLPPDT